MLSLSVSSSLEASVQLVIISSIRDLDGFLVVTVSFQ